MLRHRFFVPATLVVLSSSLLPLRATASALFDAEPSAAPQTIETASLHAGEVNVYWSRPQLSGWTGYRVVRDGTPIAAAGISDRQFRDQNLEPGSVHRYSVEAIYPDGRAVASHTVFEKLSSPSLSARFDVVVVSASSAGVSAALTAARRGLRVALLEATDRLGGIMSNGLCSTDIRRPEHSTGLFETFRQDVVHYYGGGDGLRYEPHVVNNIFKAWVAQSPNISLYLHTRVTGVVRTGDRVDGVRVRSLETGASFRLTAPTTIDATQSGDVAAAAGCRFRVGREARSEEEPHAGVIYYDRANDKLLAGSTGAGDRRLMSYAYLLVVKDYGPGTDRTLVKPPGYDEQQFLHSPSWANSWAVTSGAMPAHKYELNQHPEGNDLQEVNYRWPFASERDRDRIRAIYRNHVLGYLYYLQTHDGKRSLGLPDDEFPENGGFPETLYVREARRVVGLANLRERDVTDAGVRIRPDGAGVGDYPMDSHAVRPKTDWDRPDMGEGEYWLYRYTPWYQIPVGVVIPADREGLLVAEAVSATHVGFGTLRLEPVRMEMGAICGELAALKAQSNIEAHDAPPSMLQDRLTHGGQLIYWHRDISPRSSHSEAVQALSAHGFWRSTTFDESELVSRSEARTALLALQDLELKQNGARYARPIIPLPPDDWLSSVRNGARTALTRGQFAIWLASLQEQALEAVGQQDYGRGVGSSGYPDLDLTTPVGRAADWLRRHYITVDSWNGTRFTRDGIALFSAELPIRRGDFAEALFLAQRDIPAAFFHPPEVVEPSIVPAAPRVP